MIPSDISADHEAALPEGRMDHQRLLETAIVKAGQNTIHAFRLDFRNNKERAACMSKACADDKHSSLKSC